MSAVPAALAGAITVTCVWLALFTNAVLPPNFTDVAPSRLVPVIVTLCPPAVGPLFGEMLDIVGVDGKVDDET